MAKSHELAGELIAGHFVEHRGGDLMFYLLFLLASVLSKISVILCRSILLVGETGENHKHVTSH